jgi:S1-C subfamily serine protease
MQHARTFLTAVTAAGVLSAAGCVIVVDHDGEPHSYSEWNSSPRIGVQLADVSHATAAQAGAQAARSCVITHVYPDSPAERAGLQQYDVVTAIDGNDYATEGALTSAIRGRQPGDTITLTIVRAGQKQDVQVVVEER